MNQPTTARYNIDTSAILVELNSGVWTARKLDRGTTDELVHNKNAGSKDAARVNKHLLAGRPELDNIVKHIGTVRNQYFYPQTLPWSDAGLRLLPTVRFVDFNTRMQEEETKFWDMAEHFIGVYPSLITAQAMALGDMFKRDEYPTVDQIRQKFYFKVNYIPVPAAGDFRIDIGNAAAQELQAKFQQYATESIDNAMKDIRMRLKEHLERMSDRLTIETVGGETKVRTFHNSLVENGLELCDLIKGLNLVGDVDLEKARSGLELLLVGVTPTDLRKNVEIRKDVKSNVDAILKEMSW